MRKVLIANRGEIAVRIARTCRAMAIGTVAVHSDPDADAPHVAACDEAVRLGGDTPATSYLRQGRLLDAAARSGADAIHPGFGFLAENAAFAGAVQEAGLTWIGPSPDVIAAMGDKVEAKRRMAAAGVPLLPSAELADGADVEAAGAAVGFPLMVKAAAGGGGKGMRVVEDPDGLVDAVAAARRESGAAFGDDRVFLERYVARARHVEVQVVGDTHGDVVHLFERECSIQRRHQKVVEESPAPGVTEERRAQLCAAAVDAALAVKYVNAGTVEFVLDDDVLAHPLDDDVLAHPLDDDPGFYFLEMNTRLQVEHPVTEAVTGIDLVRWQLLVAQGEPLPRKQDEITSHGHAIEVRLYAEDPHNDYLPATGTLTGFRPASEVPLRWESGVAEGSAVSPFYDPMLAKVIGHAPTRREAAALLARGLEHTVLQGVVTNRDLLVAVLRDRAFLDGATTTSFLAERFPRVDDRRFPPSPATADLAVVVALVAEQVDGHRSSGVLRSVPAGFTNTSLGPVPIGVVVAGQRRDTTIEPVGGTWSVDPGDGTVRSVTVLDRDGDAVVVDVDGHRVRARVHADGPSVQVVIPDGNVTLLREPRFPAVATMAEPGAAVSPMPGSVVQVTVAEGERVAVGDVLVVVEAMKMEHRVTADVDGTVASVHVQAGTQVEVDDVLVVVDPDEE